MTAEQLEVDVRDDGVALVTLDHPPLNLITLDLTARLIEVAKSLGDDSSVRVIVIVGAGTRAFCAGADVKEFAAVRDKVVDKKLRRENAAMTAVATLPVPTVAAINGLALGGGCELAIACDLRIMDASAVMGFPEILLGVFPGAGGVFRLPRIVGISHALDLLYSGRRVGAAEAHRMGLVNEVAPAGSALTRALELAAMLASRPALALSLIKSGAHASFTQTTDEAMAQTLRDSDTVFSGPDIVEGLAAFFDKRVARFSASRFVRSHRAGLSSTNAQGTKTTGDDA